jgi:hypothetical protein
MQIGIVGAGNVGGALGKSWAHKGHDVVWAVRDPENAKYRDVVAAAGGKGRIGTMKEVAKAEVVVLATPFSAAKDALLELGELKGKVVVDCTNPVTADYSALTVGFTTSAAEQIAQAATGAKVVKAFNTTGAGNMANPAFGADRASMFICGDDATAKGTVARLAQDLGFDPVDSGPLGNARLLEPLAMLWIYLAYAGGQGPNVAFKLLRR